MSAYFKVIKILKLIRELESDGKEIVYISEYQVEHFLGNAIELINLSLIHI